MILAIFAVISAAIAYGVDRAQRGAVSGTVYLFGGGVVAGLGVYSIAYENIHVMFGMMAAVDLLIFVVWPIWIISLVVRRRARWPWLLVVGVLTAIGVDAHFVEPTALEETTVVIESDKVAKPTLIAIIADLQTDDPGPYERDALKRVMTKRPDLILLPGDFVHAVGPPPEHYAMQDKLRELLLEVGLKAPLGAYAVQGNVDSPRNWTRIFEGTDVTPWTKTSSQSIGEFSVWGLTLWDSFDEQLHLARQPGFNIAFGHGPDFALGTIEADLLIAGHTHGGQVQLPFIGPLVTMSSVPRAWASGTTQLSGGRTLIVSRGIGMERGPAPGVRFLCRPELVFVELRPRTSGGASPGRRETKAR